MPIEPTWATEFKEKGILFLAIVVQKLNVSETLDSWWR